jgi:hypothetical protein
MAGDPDALARRAGRHLKSHSPRCLATLPRSASHHLGAQLLPVVCVNPAELLLRLGRVADQKIDLGRAEVARIDFDQDLAGLAIAALLLGAFAAPPDGSPLR